MYVCVCLLNVGVFTREDRHTDDMKNKQAGIAHEELKTDRKAWIFGGGSTIYIYNIIILNYHKTGLPKKGTRMETIGNIYAAIKPYTACLAFVAP